MLGMELSYMFELRSEICCASTSLPCTSFELQRKCRLLVGSEIHRIFSSKCVILIFEFV